MAQALMADILATSGCDEKLTVEAAGLRAVNGKAPSDNAIAVMKNRGIDISRFSSRKLDEDIVAAADLILAMNDRQKTEVLDTYQSHAPKTLTLAEASRIARNFKSAIDSKVELPRKGMVNYHHESDIGQRLKSIADFGNIESSLEVTKDGQAFMNALNVNSNDEIFDPFGGSLDEYERCAKLIEQNIAYIVSFLCDGG